MSGFQCIFCGSSDSTGRFFARREAESLELKGCRRCGCEALWPQPSNEWLTEEYAGYFKKRGGELERPKKEYFRRLLADTKLDFASKRVLEIGPGEGDCLVALHESCPTARLSAVEANSESKEFFKEIRCHHFDQSLEAWLKSDSKEQFDFILAFDLFEHLRDPIHTLKMLVRRNLTPGGRLIATFPNAESLSRKMLGKLWPQYKVEHLFYFSDAAIRRLETQVGLERLAFESLSKSLPLEYLIRVGSQFGPKPVQAVIGWVGGLFPRALRRRSLSLRFGESLWIASKPG